MNTLLSYNHRFNDFTAIFPSFGPLEYELKQVLNQNGIEAYKVNIINDGIIRNHYVIKEDTETGKYIKLRKLPNFIEENNNLGWLNKAKRTMEEMLTNPPEETLTNYYEIYTGLQLLVGRTVINTTKHFKKQPIKQQPHTQPTPQQHSLNYENINDVDKFIIECKKYN